MKIYVVEVLGQDRDWDYEAIVTENPVAADAEFDAPLGEYESCKLMYVWENGVRSELPIKTKR